MNAHPPLRRPGGLPVCDDRGWHILVEEPRGGYVALQKYNYPDEETADAAYAELLRTSRAPRGSRD